MLLFLDIDGLMRLSKQYDIQLIEDVAQSFNGNDNDNGKFLEATEHIEQIVNSIGEVMIKYGK